MSKKPMNKKLILGAAILILGALAYVGYSKQSSTMSEASESVAQETVDASLLTPRPSDLIEGDINALVTIVEYNSLTCPHCAHFSKEVLPQLEKEFITPGRAKLVIRHFPLNEPAVRASQLVECVGAQGGDRVQFMKALFDTQEKWAFAETYMADLKKIAAVGGVDSAAFESCVADKNLETKILNSRQEASDKLKVTGTPYFFVNGTPLETNDLAGFRTAIEAAEKARQ